MITTVTLNTAVDVTYVVDPIQHGGSHQLASVRRRAGGKGINAARFLAALGHFTTVTGLVGGAAGETVRRDLAVSVLPDAVVPIAGETRHTVTVVEEEADDASVFLEVGPLATAREWTEFTAVYGRLLGRFQAVVPSGSLPPGLPDDTCAELVVLARQQNVPGSWTPRDAVLGFSLFSAVRDAVPRTSGPARLLRSRRRGPDQGSGRRHDEDQYGDPPGRGLHRSRPLRTANPRDFRGPSPPSVSGTRGHVTGDPAPSATARPGPRRSLLLGPVLRLALFRLRPRDPRAPPRHARSQQAVRAGAPLSPHSRPARATTRVSRAGPAPTPPQVT